MPNQPQARNRRERRAFLLGLRAERTEEAIVMCHEHDDATELCNRDCVEASHYEIWRTRDTIEDAIEALPTKLQAMAEGARAGGRTHRATIRRRHFAEWHRCELAAGWAKALRTRAPFNAGTREMVRGIIAANKARIAALVARAEQWLHELVLQQKVGA